MIHLSVPGRGDIHLTHLVLDLNGTIAAGGAVLPGVPEQLARLTPHLHAHLLTADTRGTGGAIAQQLGLTLHRLPPGDEAAAKRAYVTALGAEHVVAIGNGMNDVEMLHAAALGIAVLGPEGLAIPALLAAQVLVPDILTALDALLDPIRLIATLRA
ncbi:MAG: HAD family hydrolase [Chloroflexi bacterium]|nr:HAD family hydrolase [Chloroflexota bacterium]MBU1750099.1 HAD family hydrolase [Chloroflexota bacterium]